ncbi:MAG: PAS domain S-box protein, partial [Armatimonadetes bacterium]|nr:PAS domain S-box protein [Armatimonadota bacterium]
MTLYGRMAVVTIAFTLALGVAAGFVVGGVMRDELRAESARRGKLIAADIARDIYSAVMSGDYELARKRLRERVAARRDLLCAWVIDAEGHVFAHSFDGPPPMELDEASSATSSSPDHFLSRRMKSTGPMLVVGCPLAEGRSEHLHVGLDESEALAGAARVRSRVIFASLLVAGFAAIVMLLVAGRMTLPVRRLTEAMRAFGRGEVSELSPPPGSGVEVEQLAEAFNSMTTARRRAEVALHLSEERFSQVFAESPVGIMIFDEAGGIIEANPASLRIFGIGDIADLADADMVELFQLLDDQRDRVLAGELLRCEIEVDFGTSPLPATSRRGDRAFLQVTIGPLIHADDGRPASFLAQVQDVTEEVRVLEDLQQARERAEQYLDVAGVMLLALDRDGTVALINRWGCEILGRPEEEILGRRWVDEFVPARLRDEVREFFNQIIAGEHGEMSVGENPVLCADGSERLISWRNAVLRDARGEITGTLSSGEDVTEHHRAEEELRRSEELFRTLVESMGDGLIMMDTEGRMTYANRATREILGYDDDNIADIKVTDFLDEENLAVFTEQWERRMRDRATSTYELRVRAASSRMVPLLVTATPLLDAQGEVIGSLAVLKDITDHAQAVQALRESEQRYRALADALPQIIFEADVNGRLTFTNRYA